MCVFYWPPLGSPWTPSPSHHVKLLVFLCLVTFFRRSLIGLFISFRSSPPLVSQLFLAWDQVFNSSTNSKQTSLKTRSHRAPDSTGERRNPAEIHKKTEARSRMSMVIEMYRTKGRNGEGTEQDHVRLSHVNEELSPEKHCICSQ